MKLHWVYSVMGNFGSGKTFWTFLEISKLDKSKNLIIANVPYKFVDVFFSKAEELYSIIESLEKWIWDTNNEIENYFYSMQSYKNIVLIIDEAHLYFNSRRRDKWWLMDRLDIILTQCRKRNIKVFFISQRLKRVDLNIRRMTDYVIRYKRQWIPILWIQRSIRTIYENAGDVADIQWDESKTYVMNSDWSSKSDVEKSVIESDLFRPMLKIFRIPIGKRISSRDLENFKGEAHNSYFISGLEAENTQNEVKTDLLYSYEKPLTERERKFKDWLYKNMPTLVSFVRKKENTDLDYTPVRISSKNRFYIEDVNNGHDSTIPIRSYQRGDTCDLADNGESADKWDLILNKVERKLDEIQDWKRSWTARRFSDWVNWSGSEDQIHWTDSITSSSSKSSSKIRIKSRS